MVLGSVLVLAEYAGCLQLVGMVGAGDGFWCWHTVGSWDSRRLAAFWGCWVVLFLFPLLGESHRCGVVSGCGGCCLRTA